MASIKRIAADLLIAMAGSLLTALSISVFAAPNRIAPGGVSGIATALSYLIDAPIGFITFLLNVPLLIFAWKKLGHIFIAKTIVAIIVLSLGMDIFASLIPPYTGDRLLCAIISGGLGGAGIGMLLVRGISTGGTDLISLILKKARVPFSVGQLLIIIDGIVVLFAVLVFKDVEVALYSAVTIVVTSKCIDIIQEGMDRAKAIYIVTEKAQAILDKIAFDMGRGATMISAKGGFTGEDKNILLVIARRNEVASTLRVVRSIDTGAFIILLDAAEVYGKGFKG